MFPKRFCMLSRNNFIVDFYYNSEWEPDEHHRKILPYQLVLDEGSLYLYGASWNDKENPRLFNLSKIHNIQVISKSTFKLPSNFRFHEDSEQGRFCAFQYDDYFDFKIEFYGDARKSCHEYVWSDNQVLKENQKENKTILTFTTSQWIPVKKWLLSFGCDVKPLEPDWFVEDWKKTLLEMIKIVRSS